jgi:hypothetical protein
MYRGAIIRGNNARPESRIQIQNEYSVTGCKLSRFWVMMAKHTVKRLQRMVDGRRSLEAT